MTREKYLANIDAVLKKALAKNSVSLSEKNAIKFSEKLVSNGQIQKFAFDVYKVNDDPYNGLWVLQDINGAAHLVRASDPRYESVNSGDWGAVSDYNRENVTLTYKSRPIARFSSKSYGFAPEEVITFKEALLERIGEDDSFVKEVFAEQPESKRSSIKQAFPELNKYV